MINLELRAFVKKYLKDTKTDKETFAKNCGTSYSNLQKFLKGEKVKYTIYRNYLLYLVDVLKENQQIPQKITQLG